MKRIGLSYEEIIEILQEAMSPEKRVDIVALREVVAKAIVKNNDKLLSDIKQLTK